MGYTYDASKEYLHWPNAKVVSVTLKRYDGDKSLKVLYAVRGDITNAQQTFANVALHGNEMTWAIPVDLLDGNEIENGDEITYSGETYKVKQVQMVRFDSQFLCLCVKLK